MLYYIITWNAIKCERVGKGTEPVAEKDMELLRQQLDADPTMNLIKDIEGSTEGLHHLWDEEKNLFNEVKVTMKLAKKKLFFIFNTFILMNQFFL